MPLTVLFGALAIALYYRYQWQAEEPATRVPIRPPPPATEIQRPPPIAIVPPDTEDPAIPLPPLEESDPEMRGWLTELYGPERIARFLVPEDIVRRLVTTIDNLPRERVALQLRPVQPTPGEFVTSGSQDALVLDAENYARYQPFVRLVDSADAETLAALYERLYPLFEQAYQELGYPDGNFHARLIDVIDHLLETPEIGGPIRLTRPNVLYEFEREDLESLSAGQKLLIRMGIENAGVVKAKLRALRAELLEHGNAG